MDQGLPVGFENTANTWQNMPMMAGFYTGLQNQAAQDNIQMLQRAFANEQAFKDQTRPIELQNLQGANELQKAQAAQALANARKIGIGADREQGTLLSDIVAGISKNQAEVVANQGKQLSEKAKMYQSMSILAADPNVPGFQKVKMIMDNLGVEDPTGQIAQGMLANIDKLPKVLADQAEHQFQSDSATKLQAQKDESDLKRTKITAEASRYGADRSLEGVKYATDGRVQAANTKNGAVSFEVQISKFKKASEKIAALVDYANSVDNENPALAASLRARANDPTLMAQRDAELAAAGQATISPEVAPGVMVPRTSQVNIPAAQGAAPPQARPGADPLEGRTATGPNGQKVIRKNGQWVPM